MKKVGRTLRARALVLAITLFTSAMAFGGVAYAGLMTIQGTVTDPLGRPLANVAVSDGSKSAYTNSSGNYVLEEDVIDTYQVTATRSGLNRQTISVNPVTAMLPVNFQMTYVLSGAISPSIFNNNTPTTVSITATSYAPVSGQCVSFTDSTSTQQVPLSLSSQAGSASTWTGSYTVPPGRADGRYGWSLTSTDCAASTQLTNTPSYTFLIDSVAPVIDPLTITPLDFGNTVFPSQPLLVKITDIGGSGVNGASIVFTLTDETAGTSTNVPAASHNPNTGWAKTAAQSLTVGHVYRVSVSASDYAGNSASASHSPLGEGGGFLTTTITTEPTMALIPPTPCSVSALDPARQTRTVTCQDVPLKVTDTAVTIGASRHHLANTGYIEQTTPLDSAVLETSLAGISLTKKAFASGTKSRVPMPFQVQQGPRNSAETLSVPGVTHNLGTLTAEVDPAWTEVSLRMPEVTTTSSTEACADPGTGGAMVKCIPDPMLNRYIVVLKETPDPQGIAVAHASRFSMIVSYVYSSVFDGYAAVLPLAKAAALASDPAVDFIARDGEVSVQSETTPSGVRRIRASDTTNGGEGVLVAVLDTGVDLSHPDISPNTSTLPPLNCSTSPLASDLHGHGTHVAGTVAASQNGAGVIGVAPKADLWSVKVLDDRGRGAWANIICGLEAVHLNSPQLGLLDPVRVVNLSLGGPGTDDGQCGRRVLAPLHVAICAVVEAGVVVVGAAGNQGSDVANFVPASFNEVIAVTALGDSDGNPCGGGEATSNGRDDTFASFSNYARLESDLSHLLAAPGVDIPSTAPSNDYSILSGTSMAAPHVSGAAAIYLFQRSLSTKPSDVLNALRDRSEPGNVNFQDECDGLGVSHVGTGTHPEPVIRASAL